MSLIRSAIHWGSPAPPPPLVGFGNDGTGTPPAGISINPSNAWAAIHAASPGDVLLPVPGDYADAFDGLNNLNFGTGAGVTIYGQTGVSAYTFDVHNTIGLHVKYLTVNTLPVTTTAGVYFVGSDHCSADHFDVFGDPANAVNRRTGASVRSSTNVGITNFNLSKVSNGVVLYSDARDGSDNYNIDVVGGHIQKYVENAMFFNGAGNLRVAKVSIKDYDLVSGGHADLGQFNQCWKIGAGRFDPETGTNYGVLFEECYGDGSINSHEPQALGFSESVNDFIYRRLGSFCGTIEGMSLSGCHRGLVYDNFLQGFGKDQGNPTQDAGTRIYVRDGSTFITLTNNVSCYINTNATGDCSDITPATGLGSNTIVPVVATLADRSYVDAWLAAHPTNIGAF